MLLSSVKPKYLWIVALPLAIGITSLAWSDRSTTAQATKEKRVLDTLPDKNRNNPNIYDDRNPPADIDQRLQQLEKAMEQLDMKLQEKDWEKIQKKLDAALSKIDIEKLQKQFDEAMKNIDMHKIKLETEEAIKKVDWDKIQKEINAAMAQAKDKIDSKEFQHELKEAMKEAKKSIEEAKKIDFKKINEEMERTREELQKEKGRIIKELQETKEEILKNKVNIKAELEKAKIEINNSKNELLSYKAMINEMEKDGLLNTKEDYSINYNEGQLNINGKIQSKNTTDKYRSWFKKVKVEIKKENGNFNLNSNN